MITNRRASSAIVLGGVGVGAATAFISVIVAARTLPAAAAGAYLVISTAVALLALALRFGVDRLAIRLLSAPTANQDDLDAKERSLFRAALALALSGLVVSGLVAFGAYNSGNRYLPYPGMAAAVPVWIGCEIARGIVSEILRGRGRIIPATIFGDGGRNFVGMSGLVAAAVSGWADLSHYIYVSAAAGLFVAVGSLFWLSRDTRRRALPVSGRSTTSVSRLIVAGLPFLTTAVTTWISNQSDTIVASGVLAPKDVGTYAIASKSALVLQLPAVALALIVAPAAQQLVHSPKSLAWVRGQTLLVGLLTVVASVTLMAFGSPIVAAVYGVEYRSAGALLAVLSVGTALTALTGPAAILLMMLGDARYVARVTIGACLLQIATMFGLGIRWGPVGIAIASAGGTAAVNIVTLRALLRRYGIRVDMLASISDWLNRHFVRTNRGAGRLERYRPDLTTVVALTMVVPLVGLACGSSSRTFALAGLTFVAIAILPFDALAGLTATACVVTGFGYRFGGFNLRPDMLLGLACLGSAAIHGRLADVWRALRLRYVQALALFAVANLFSTFVFSTNLRVSVAVAAWYILDVLIVAVLAASFAPRPQVLRRVLYWAAAALLTYALFAWLCAVIFGTHFGVSRQIGSTVRARGFAYEPNILAAAAAMWIVVLLSRSARSRADYLIVIVGIVDILASQTRAALIAVILGFAVSAFSHKPRPRAAVSGTRQFVAMILIAFGGLVVIVNPSSLGKFGSLGGQTSSLRLSYWSQALADMHGWDWLFGHGSDSFGLTHVDPTSIYSSVPSPAYIGNLPIQSLYDTGMVGLLCLALAARALVRSSNEQVGRAVALLLAFAVVAMGTSPFYFSYFWALGLVWTLRGGPVSGAAGPAVGRMHRVSDRVGVGATNGSPQELALDIQVVAKADLLQ